MKIGKTFGQEVIVAGLNTVPFSWDVDGNFTFGDSATQEQKVAVMALYASHDPSKEPLAYKDIEVNSKADVDKITQRLISELGEEKAKTLKLIAGSGACPEWDAFIAARAALVKEGDEFIAGNKLT